MRIFITGVTGLVGSHMADFLLKNKEVSQVWGLRRFRSYNGNIRCLKGLKIVDGDITDPYSIESLVNLIRPDLIFHEAAVSYPSVSWSAPLVSLQTNILGTAIILEAARKLVKKPKVFLSCSSAEYGLAAKFPTPENAPLKPLSPYGVGKVTTELLGYQYFVNYKLPTYLGRYFIQVGPGQDERTSIQTFCKQIVLIERGLQTPVIYVGNLKAKRDFLDVRDGVNAAWSLVKKGRPGEPYNICSGRAHSLKEVLGMVLKQGKKKVKVVVDPQRLRVSDEPIIHGSHAKITKETGWAPKIPLSETIASVLDYWRSKV